MSNIYKDLNNQSKQTTKISKFSQKHKLNEKISEINILANIKSFNQEKKAEGFDIKSLKNIQLNNNNYMSFAAGNNTKSNTKSNIISFKRKSILNSCIKYEQVSKFKLKVVRKYQNH